MKNFNFSHITYNSRRGKTVHIPSEICVCCDRAQFAKLGVPTPGTEKIVNSLCLEILSRLLRLFQARKSSRLSDTYKCFNCVAGKIKFNKFFAQTVQRKVAPTVLSKLPKVWTQKLFTILRRLYRPLAGCVSGGTVILTAGGMVGPTGRLETWY
jgi:hypothetical protein